MGQQILTGLHRDVQASHAAIAKTVGLSAPAVGERVRKLDYECPLLRIRMGSNGCHCCQQASRVSNPQFWSNELASVNEFTLKD